MTDKAKSPLVEKAEVVFNALLKTESKILTKIQILQILDKDFHPYYSYLVSALASIGKIIRKAGRTGGIELRTVQGMKPELVEDNYKKLEDYFKSIEIIKPITEVKETLSDAGIKAEKDLYPSLKAYLEKLGMFDRVEINAQTRTGGKWENVDLVCVKIHTLKYHFGIYPKLTGIEVKREFPNITHIQQTASSLRYCHSAYLCFYDADYRGKDVDILLQKLRDEEIWELSNVFTIGLLVAYKPQAKSTNIRYQLIKEAPETPLDFTSVEDGIDLLLSAEAKNELIKKLREQYKSIT